VTRPALTPWIVAASSAAIDQLTKAAASTPRRNDAYALGAFSGPRPALVAVAVAVVAVFGYLSVRMAARVGVPMWAVALVLAGCASNIADRVVLGSVRDFIVLPYVTVNVADLAVATGCVAILVAVVAHLATRGAPT
jgi:lipoprotein signal peptidase